MQTDPSETPLPVAAELRDICQTLTGLPTPDDQLATRLQFIADLLADAGSLPSAPLLLWRESDESSVRHALISQELLVGRKPGEPGVTLPRDKLLSRRHFVIRATGAECTLEDLKAHNGTAINRTDNRVQAHVLRDGDLILAGNHIFVFLDQGKTT